MSTSEKLYHAVLAMDAYNRRQASGDSVSMALPGDTPGGDSSIGNADRINIMLPSDYDEYGFFATAYDLNGDTIISFRGTDSQAGLGELAEDVFFGWASGTGANSPQPLFAEQFYESVTAADLFAGPQSDVVLIGHSLGGGLAGYISTLSGTDAVVFNEMPYAEAAVYGWAAANLANGVSSVIGLLDGTEAPTIPTPSASNVDAYRTIDEALFGVRFAAPAAACRLVQTSEQMV